MSIKIATWNVNSIKARESHVRQWLDSVKPNVVMLQELKGVEFPYVFDGYQAQTVGQKTYNGVAILSQSPVTVILNKLPGDDADEQARYLEADYNGLRLINIYLPNGNPVDTEKYPYKLSWMARLYTRLKELREAEIPFLIGGDFNIIPQERDCWDPKVWRGDALFKLESRLAFRKLIHLGLTDAFRALNNADEQYTFWDYQGGCWPANKGIRIDHFLLSPPIADRLINCTIDKTPRGWEKASDHTPVIVEIA